MVLTATNLLLCWMLSSRPRHASRLASSTSTNRGYGQVNMTVYLGNYAVPNDNGTAYTRQRNEIQSVLETFGTSHVTGITVGNEFMLNYLTANGATDPNSAIGDTGAALLIADINDTRSMISQMSLNKTLTIGTADAGAFFNTLVLEQVDFGVNASSQAR